jgi:hypothetical protein
MTRREALILGPVGLRSMARAATPPNVRFGVRTPFPRIGLRERALLIKRLGYEGIELGAEWLNQPVASIRKELDGTGVLVSAIVGSIALLDTDPDKRAQAVELDRRRLIMAKELGADCLIEVPVFGPDRFHDISPVMSPREVEQRLLVAGLQQIAEDVRRTGITVLLEPLTRKETHFMNLQSQGRGGHPGHRRPRLQAAQRFLPYAVGRKRYRRDAISIRRIHRLRTPCRRREAD